MDTGPCEALDREGARNVDDELPVIGVLRNLLARPAELHVSQVHPTRLPHLNKVLPNSADLFEIATTLIWRNVSA